MIMLNDKLVVPLHNAILTYSYWKIMMYKKLISIVTAVSLFAIGGCKNQNTEEKPPEVKPPVEANEAQGANEPPKPQEPVDPEKLARDKARSQQLLAEGKILPPRAEIVFKAGKIEGNLSAEDAERSYLYRKSAVRRCYMYELAYRAEAKGVVKTTIRHEAPKKATVVDYTSAIESEEFNNCIKEAVSTWSLPQGVTLEVILDFSSTPAPTLEEVRESNRGLHDHNHEHGDMDHDHGEMDREHGDIEHEHGDMDHDHGDAAPNDGETKPEEKRRFEIPKKAPLNPNRL